MPTGMISVSLPYECDASLSHRSCAQSAETILPNGSTMCCRISEIVPLSLKISSFIQYEGKMSRTLVHC